MIVFDNVDDLRADIFIEFSDTRPIMRIDKIDLRTLEKKDGLLSFFLSLMMLTEYSMSIHSRLLLYVTTK